MGMGFVQKNGYKPNPSVMRRWTRLLIVMPELKAEGKLDLNMRDVSSSHVWAGCVRYLLVPQVQ